MKNIACWEIFSGCDIFSGSTVRPAKFSFCTHCSSCCNVDHFSTIHLSFCFTLFPFCYNFLFLLILSLVIAFAFGSFCNFAWLGQYISSRTIIKEKFCLVIKLAGSFQLCRSFSFSLHVLSLSLPFLVAKHPPRMITWRMRG